jgi:hypothetical protein
MEIAENCMDTSWRGRFHWLTQSEGNFMPMKIMGKILFPRLPAWQQHRGAKTVFAVIMTAVIFAAIVGAMIYYGNTKR